MGELPDAANIPQATSSLNRSFPNSLFPVGVRQDTSETARADVKKAITDDVGELRCNKLLQKAFAKTVSSETITELTQWLQDRTNKEPSSGNFSLLFARIVLSIVGSGANWNDTKRNAVAKLCAIVEQRPFPTALWSDFVQKHLEAPEIISGVLTGCQQDTGHLEDHIRDVVEKKHRDLKLATVRTVFVFGYSAAIMAALQAFVKYTATPLRILTPQLYLRHTADGQLLADDIQVRGIPARVEVLEDKEFARRLRKGNASLLLIGAKVVGKRLTGEIEIATSGNGRDVVEMAATVGIPTVVITGLYKLWPIRTYERYRPLLVVEQEQPSPRSSIVGGSLISHIVTEDDLFSYKRFRDVYDIFFSIAGVPVPSIRTRLRAQKGSSVSICEATIRKIANEVQQKEDKHERLPQHFRTAQVFYEQMKKNKEWFNMHRGKYLAIVGKTVVGVEEDFHTLASVVRSKYGYGPLFMPQVTEGPMVASITPSVKRVRPIRD